MAFRQTNRLNLHNNSDAAFRAWIIEFISDFTFGGHIVQTADTGQVDTTTATRPSQNATTHYAIFRFDDPLQATSPVFIRVNFSSSTSASIPRLMFIFGTGTNGAGTLTNATPFIFVDGNNFTTVPNQTYPSYVCTHPGLINLAFNIGAPSLLHGFFFISIQRTLNQTGTAPTGEGLVIYMNQLQYYTRLGTGVISLESRNYCLSPSSPNTSGSPFLVFRHFVSVPQVRPVLGLLSVINTEIGTGVIFDARPVGSTNRTYIALGPGSIGLNGTVAGNSTAYTFAMLYD